VVRVPDLSVCRQVPLTIDPSDLGITTTCCSTFLGFTRPFSRPLSHFSKAASCHRLRHCKGHLENKDHLATKKKNQNLKNYYVVNTDPKQFFYTVVTNIQALDLAGDELLYSFVIARRRLSI